MGFFAKLFGGGSNIEGLRKAVKDKRYADARLIGDELLAKSPEAGDAEEIARLCAEAGDCLARMNFDEARGQRACGREEQAVDHIQLALEQVCDPELRAEIEAFADSDAPVVPQVPKAAKPVQAASCASCATPVMSDEFVAPDDEELQLELILTSYPPELAERYLAKSALFREAFLLSHSGEDKEARKLWDKVLVAERDELYAFEFGSLLARAGQLAKARKLLEKALSVQPGFLFALDALIPVLIGLKAFAEAETLLQQGLAQGINPAYCHAQLMQLYARQGQLESAVEQADAGLAAGNSDPNFLMQAAAIVERTGDDKKAEAILKRVPSSGCGGSAISLPLAEFYLRHGRELGKILDTFNGACRQEPDNPRWQLRVAQTYMARKWNKDGLKLLRKVADDPRLDPALAREAQELLAQRAG
ncbi:MAG: hypothetical protein C0622_13315 [Desulfuromonas sp.]|nr:MAG: hypothetical protein C0622_13315 [Desulfuromonas sp.]